MTSDRSIRLRWFLALVVAGWQATACTDPEETLERKCARLREHVLELRLEAIPEQDRAAHRQALSGALGNQFAEQCQSLTVKQVDCALAATDVVASVACSESRR
jgi:hypothetical protein